VKAVPFLRPGGVAALCALALAGWAAAEAAPGEDLVRTGQRLYREGRGASGKPVAAVVQGDVPVTGAQVTCQSCHGRSGFGTIESGRIPPSIAAPQLFAADRQRRRPAYDGATLARAAREGIDSAGRPLDPLMPRYRLGDRDLAALEAYLRQLGTAESPGLGPQTMLLATVFAGDVPAEVERAVLDVIEAYIADRNRSEPRRLRGGHAPADPKEALRLWKLDVWRLGGPPERWRAQLEARYREHPPFALVGGMASGSWQPIHEFCEAEQMPCLLPDTDLPPPDDGSFYSLYFSRGLRMEAEVMAAVLAEGGLGKDVVAVAEGGPASVSRVAAASFTQEVERRGGRVRTLDAAAARAEEFGAGVSAIVLWVKAESVRRLAGDLANGAAPIFLSSTLLDSRWDSVPETLRARARVIHLTALPGEHDSALERFRTWARARKVRIREERHQALAYFACLTLGEGYGHMSRVISRDYLMDLLQHSPNLTAYLPLYLRGGITPGQRVLSHGGWVIDLSGRRKPAWVVP
jgi:mono/diheme cytochrome c family protein